MASNLFRQSHVDGTTILVRRRITQGRKPSGLAKPELVILLAEDDKMLNKIGEKLDYLWNRNEFIRMAVHAYLSNCVYTELLKS